MTGRELGLVTCRTCGATYEPLAWSALAMVERIDAREVERIISGWPEGTHVEARPCGKCGRTIVARRPRDPSA